MSREEKIISIISENKKIEVNKLSKLLNVSQVTIRKDLDKLETRGIICRQHGFALIGNQEDISYRLAYNHNLKRKIALAAADLVSDGETIMIESGSTCTLLAEELAYNKNDVTIITNSCFIASYIRKAESVKVVLIGGEYQKNSQVNVGPLARKLISEFHIDKLFVGIDGFDEKRGFTGNDIARCDTVNAMMTIANKVIVLTDSSKFSQIGVVSAFSFEDISMIYTDNRISKDHTQFLKEKNIELIIV